MSLITQCPACTTMFKVVPDQLRVSEGWVRCGQCDEVFDANAHLRTSVASPEAAPTAESALTAESGDYDWGPLAGDQPTVASTNVQPAGPYLAEPARAPEQDGSQASPLPEPETGGEAPVSDPFLEKSPQELSAFLDSDPAGLARSKDADVALPMADASHAPTPSFLVRGSTKARRPSAVLRGCIALGCVVLTLVLVGQFLLQERDRIAVKQPALAPLVAALCSVMGCSIEAFRDIDALVIDSSSFAKSNAQTYRLQFTIKNVGSVTVATPALELALTDTADQTMVRRVVYASEFGNRQGTLGPGDEVSATLPIQIRLANGSEKIAGYRLLAFYP